jgi:ribonuclease HI
MPVITLCTDGGGLNPGPGGWAAILLFGGRARVVTGCLGQSTNNQMETEAVTGGLLALRKPCDVHIVTDSQYVEFGLRRLMRNSMLKTNVDFWKRCNQAMKGHRIVNITHVDGHKGHPWNELCDSFSSFCATNQVAFDATFPEQVMLDMSLKAVRAKGLG